jgi:hypothetical protein
LDGQATASRSSVELRPQIGIDRAKIGVSVITGFERSRGGRAVLKTTTVIAGLAALAAFAGLGPVSADMLRQTGPGGPSIATLQAPPSSAFRHMQARLHDDRTAMQAFRPGYAFWQHVFTIPDGAIAFGSAMDGRLLAVFPTAGDWARSGDWKEGALAGTTLGVRFSARLNDRRDQVAQLIEREAGPVLHNPTRGTFLLPNVRRYGAFLGEWGAIYERFGVPAEVGLAQVVIESGLNGTVRSKARAIGFCQWLAGNWKRLQRLSPHVIEGHNQTTQAPYCAAYLAVLATKYRTFIPALSEHHAGGTNVGRTVINGARLGGRDIREQYFLGAEFTRELRALAPRDYRDIYGTYGPRSFRYAEMVFGNETNVSHLQATVPQQPIHAMRTRSAVPLAEITRRTGLPADEVRRYNPALLAQVPARADLYLPSYVADFGADVSFWHQAPSPAYVSALNDFVTLEATLDQWDSPSFVPVLETFARRFRETATEEGTVMATVLAYVIEDVQTSGRAAILNEFRANPRLQRLFDEAVTKRDRMRGTHATAR